MPSSVPPALAGSRVLEFAILDKSIRYSGHSNLFRNDEEVGPVPKLAICEVRNQRSVYLFHCDDNWDILGTEVCESADGAKLSAEQAYPGSSSLWINTGVTEQQADEYIRSIWGAQQCIFCRKTPVEVPDRQFVQKGGAWICESCIRTSYDLLAD